MKVGKIKGAVGVVEKWLKRYIDRQRMDGKDPRTRVGLLSGNVGVLSNLALFIVKLTAGWLAGSVSIMADAMNSLSDSASSVLTLLGFHFASKPPDKEHPYGYERSEYISGLLVSVVILFVGYEFLMSSINRILNPEPLTTSPLIFGLLAVSVGAKVAQGYFYKHSAALIKSRAIEATSQDSFNDVYTTLIVLAASILERFTGWTIDGYAGVLIALYILYSGVQLIRGAIDDLLGSRPNEEELSEIAQRLDAYSSIVGYHDLLVHNYGPTNAFATVHIEIDDSWSLTEAHELIDAIEKEFNEEMGIQLVCHIDPIAIQSEEHTTIYRQIKNILQSHQLNLKFHDFRIEESPNQSIIHFDVVVPDNVTLTDAELFHSIQGQTRNTIGNYELDITFDRVYLLK
ncbi:cation diffusion facilitator family transporter [Atopococcus tabaci]|uniref:cation diffusion facilitator family transporter n=1 Tax=Atopococcus tabaci TaxID=269774 RepID=UPI0012EBF2BC|nr:cation diffusion facilitator family transporter [Atopococcus tabaci]